MAAPLDLLGINRPDLKCYIGHWFLRTLRRWGLSFGSRAWRELLGGGLIALGSVKSLDSGPFQATLPASR